MKLLRLDAEVRIGELLNELPQERVIPNVKKNEPDTDVHLVANTKQAVRIGELLKELPSESSHKGETINRGNTADTPVTETAKQEIYKDVGGKQAAIRFQTLAKHKDIVEQAKAEAKANDDIVSRSLVLDMVKQEQKNSF